MSAPPTLPEGRKVLILETPNVMLRYPELVNTEGEVIDAPVHPSTWYSVRVHDGRVVKFQPTALRAADAAKSARAAAASSRQPVHAADGRQVRPGQRPDKSADARPQSHAKSLKKGSQVVITATENVHQRVPHLVGQVGIVKEVPVHPATWYKVEFPDGKVSTFRPSALRLLNSERKRKCAQRNGADSSDGEGVDCESPASTSEHERSDASVHSSKTQLAIACEQQPIIAPTSSSSDQSTLLSSLDPDLWLHKFVRIRGGRQAGQTGRVLRSGNGWVQLETSMGELAKRAYELELLDEGAAGVEDEEDRRSRAGRRLRPSQATQLMCDASPQTRKSYRRGDLTDPEDCDDTGSDNLKVDGTKVDDPVSERKTRAERLALRRDNSARSSVVCAIAPSSLAQFRGIPLVSPQTQADRREALLKFLERQKERVKSRPNLTYWLHQLIAAAVDPDKEDKMARDLLENFCPFCFMEKMPCDKFCWNSECLASPIYKSFSRAKRTDRANSSDDIGSTTDMSLSSHEDYKRQKLVLEVGMDAEHSTTDFDSSRDTADGSSNFFDREPQIFDVCTYLSTAPTMVLGGKRSREPNGFSEDAMLYRWRKWASTFTADERSMDLMHFAIPMDIPEPPRNAQLKAPASKLQNLSTAESDSGRSTIEDIISSQEEECAIMSLVAAKSVPCTVDQLNTELSPSNESLTSSALAAAAVRQAEYERCDAAASVLASLPSLIPTNVAPANIAESTPLPVKRILANESNKLRVQRSLGIDTTRGRKPSEGRIRKASDHSMSVASALGMVEGADSVFPPETLRNLAPALRTETDASTRSTSVHLKLSMSSVPPQPFGFQAASIPYNTGTAFQVPLALPSTTGLPTPFSHSL